MLKQKEPFENMFEVIYFFSAYFDLLMKTGDKSFNYQGKPVTGKKELIQNSKFWLFYLKIIRFIEVFLKNRN